MIDTYLKLQQQKRNLLHEVAQLANPEKYFGNEKTQTEMLQVAQEIINLIQSQV